MTSTSNAAPRPLPRWWLCLGFIYAGCERRESWAHLLPPGAAAASAAGALRPAPSAGEDTQDLLFWDFPLTSLRSPAGLGDGRGGGQGWTGRQRSSARGCRAGREPRDHGAAGAAQVAGSISGGCKVSARSARHGAAGPGCAGRWRLLPGPCPPPPPERAPPPPASRLLSSQPVAPRPGTPSRVPPRALGAGCPRDVDAMSAAPEREGCVGWGDPTGAEFSRASPRVPLPEPDWGLLRAMLGAWHIPSTLCGNELQPLLTLCSDFMERLSYWFRTAASLLLDTILHPSMLSVTRPDLRNRVHWCFSRQVWCFFHPPQGIVNNSGCPFSTALLLNKCSSFLAASFTLVSYFIFWKLIQPKVVFTISVWFSLIYWRECGIHICQICRHFVFLVTKIFCY